MTRSLPKRIPVKLLAVLTLFIAPIFAQTGALSPVAIQQFFDNSGHPLIGGCLYSFVTGSTTPLATYSNAILTAANTNPIVLNSSGRAPAIFLSPVSYKFVLGQRFANACPATPGTVIWSQDPVFDAGQSLKVALALPTGAGLVGYTYATSYALGTVGRAIQDAVNFSQSATYLAGTASKHLQQDSINPMDAPYNAACNNSADDTTAIQTAVNAAAARQVTFRFPGVGYCRITGTITISTAKTTMVGSGPHSGLAASAANFNMIEVAADDFTARDFALIGAAVDATNNTEGIFTTAGTPALRGSVSGVTFDNVNNGIKLDTGNNSWDIHDNTFRHLWGTSAGHGYGVFTGRVKWVHVHHNHFNGEILTAGRHCVYFADGTSFSEADNNSCIDFNSSNFVVFSANGQPASIGNRIHDNISSISVVPAPTPSILGGSVLEATGTVTDIVFANNTIISPIMPCGTAESENLGPTVNQNTQFIGNTCSNFPGKGITIYGAKSAVVDGNQLTNGSAGSHGTSAAIEISTSSNVGGHDMADGTRVTNNNIYGADLRSSLLIQNTATLATNTYVDANKFVNGTNGTNGIENSGGAVIKSGINLIDGTTLVSSTIGTLELPTGWTIQGGTTTDCASLAADMCVFGSGTNNRAIAGFSGAATTKNQVVKICNTDTGGDCFTLGENSLAKILSLRDLTNNNSWKFSGIDGSLDVVNGVLKVGGNAGLTTTKTVRASGGASDCTLIFTGGILTGGSC